METSHTTVSRQADHLSIVSIYFCWRSNQAHDLTVPSFTVLSRVRIQKNVKDLGAYLQLSQTHQRNLHSTAAACSVEKSTVLFVMYAQVPCLSPHLKSPNQHSRVISQCGSCIFICIAGTRRSYNSVCAAKQN